MSSREFEEDIARVIRTTIIHDKNFVIDPAPSNTVKSIGNYKLQILCLTFAFARGRGRISSRRYSSHWLDIGRA